MRAGKFDGVYRFWGKSVGRFFRPAPALGYGLVVYVWLAPEPAHDALRFVLRSLVRTTATVVFFDKFGRITAWEHSSYSYCFWNDGCTGGFYCGGS